MSHRSHKRTTLAVLSAGALLIPSMAFGVYNSVNDTNASAASNCNILARTISEAKCMQDMNDEVLTSMVLERQYELKDARDGKMYYVAKLKDGNVWMTQNLDFDLDENVTLTPDDTDIPANWKPNGSTWWIDDLVATEQEDRQTNDADEVSEDGFNGSQMSVDVGDLFWNGTIVQESFNANDTDLTAGIVPDFEIENAESSGDRHYHLGNYYNWLAAVASDDSEDYTDEYGEADQSICPAGWTLPTLMERAKQKRVIEVDKEVPSFGGLIGEYADAETGAWVSSPEGHPLYLNFSGLNARNVGFFGILWARNYAYYVEPEPDPDDEPQSAIGEEASFRPFGLVGYGFEYSSNYIDIAEKLADEAFIPIRCVARSREAIGADWIKGEEHEIESEEEGVLRVEAPDDGELEFIMIDDEMISEDSGIEIIEDTENGGFLITFPSEYLDTLDEGEHVVKATFTSGRSAYARLTVSSTAVPNTGAPDTGMFTKNEEDSSVKDNSGTLIVAIATSVICFGMMTVAYRATHSKFKGF